MNVANAVLKIPRWALFVLASALLAGIITLTTVVYLSNNSVATVRSTLPGMVTLEGGNWRVYCYSLGNGLSQGVNSKSFDDSAWYSTSVPATAHKILLENDSIKDPLLYGAENVDWPSGYEWWYRKSFTAEQAWKGKIVRLHVKGVMEKSDIYLNGEHIGATDGMYDETYIDVSGAMLYGENNVLAVRAAPKPAATVARVSIAANETGWKGFQFEKILRPVGMWRGVDVLISDPVYFQDTFVSTVGSLKSTSTSATIHIKHTIVNSSEKSENVIIGTNLTGSNFTSVPSWFSGKYELKPGINTVQYDMTVSGDSLRLWWPNGYGSGLPNGERYLYKLSASIYQDSVLLSSQLTDCIGIRSVEYEYAGGQSYPHYKFLYVVNGERIYMQGGNWVPSDALYRNDVMNDNYKELLWLAKDAKFTVLRVWGGGIEENPMFYQLASRYGICLIQEFWHKNEYYYPNEKEWRANADDIVKRLRNYPAIVRYSGGNELTGSEDGDRSYAESFKYVQYCKASYEEYDNTRGEFIATSPSGGNTHKWAELHYVGSEGYEAAHGNVSDGIYELGMNSVMRRESLNLYDGRARAETLWKQVGEEHIYPNEFGNYNNTDELARKTQLAQAIGTAYNMGWAKNMKWRNTASLAWAFNDMAPMSGWAMVDFYHSPKMLYYYLKREFSPIKIRASYKKYYFEPGENINIEAFVTNDTPALIQGYTASVSLLKFDGTVLSRQDAPAFSVTSGNNGGSTKVFSPRFKAPEEKGVFLLYMELLDSSGKKVSEAHYVFTTEPNRSLYTLETAVRETSLDVNSEVVDGKRLIHIKNIDKAVAFNLELTTGEIYTRKSDNYMTIMPGETKDVEITLPSGSTYTGAYSIIQYGSHPDTENLALFKPIYASQNDYKTESGMRVHSYRKALFANDGDSQKYEETQDSQWIGRTSRNAWIYVDLGKEYFIDRVVIKWGENYGRNYSIQVSDDAVSWKDAGTMSAGRGGTHTITFQAEKARYVRMDGNSSSGSYDIREFEVYQAK